MPILQEVTFQICEGPNKGLQLGSLEDINRLKKQMEDNIYKQEIAEFQEQRRQNKLSPTQLQVLAQMELQVQEQKATQSSAPEEKELDIPLDDYMIKAPIIGVIRKEMGRGRSRAAYGAEMLKINFAILNTPPLSGRPAPISAEIQTQIKSSHEIKANIVDEFYHMLTLNYKPWEEKKAEVLKYYAPIFNQFVSLGAHYLHLKYRDDKKSRFQDLIQYVMNGKSLTTGYLSQAKFTSGIFEVIGDADMRGASFAGLKKIINELLPLGANINTKLHINPDYGTFLHDYLAFEYPEADELIAFFESKRGNESNTQFDYSQLDGYGNTALLLALLTRNEKAAFALLNLNKIKGLDVGIHKPDRKGRTPLLIAAALGMDKVVKTLIDLGADLNAVDEDSHGIDYYSTLNDKELFNMLIPILHPHRAERDDDEGSKHSYLYSNDDNYSPLCFYEDGEKIQTGEDQRKHLVVLSNCPKHRERLDKVVAYLRIQSKKGDPKAQKLLPYVLKQIEHIQGKPSFLQLCKDGQALVQRSIQDIKRSFQENRLRQAALLGRVDEVEHLLHEGVDPNAGDKLRQTSLHCAVARFETVKAGVVAEAKQQGEVISEEQTVQRTQSALSNHHLVIQSLLRHSVLGLHAKNHYSRTAKEVLLQDLDEKDGSENRFTREEAVKCLQMINQFEEAEPLFVNGLRG